MLYKTRILIVLLVFGGLAQSPSSAGYLYWTDKDTAKIQRARLGRVGWIEDVLTAADGLVDPRGIALNMADNWMYWADNGTNKIRRARLDGSEPQDVVTGLSFPADLALDLDAGKVYWADRDRNEIRRANLDGTGPQTVRAGIVQPYYLALDPAGGQVYWSDFNSPTIHRANMNGTGSVEDLDFLTGLDRVRDLALDPAAGKIYWGDRDTHKVQRANLDGSGGIEDLYTSADGLDRPHGLVLDVGYEAMYWADTSTHKVMQGSTDGSSPASALNPDALSGEPWGVALDILPLDHSTSVNSYVAGDVHALDGPPGSPATVVEIAQPAIVAGYAEAFGSSTLNVTGGTIYCDLIAWDFSQINIISGDEIMDEDDRVEARDSSTVTISGGDVDADAAAYDSSTLNVLGGRVGEGLVGFDSSTLNILGGVVGEAVSAWDSSVINISGGSMNIIAARDDSRVLISGGLIDSVEAGLNSGDHTSLITITGSGFNYPFGEIPDSAGTLTGVLASGDPINASFSIYGNSSIMLVPEPATLALLVSGGLLVLRRRRK
jgi:hypothetical protein